MSSIKKKLSRYLALSVSILLVFILLATDISVDTWISNEFDKAMVNKVRLLTTLVSEEVGELDFDFADEFMPEFSGKNDPEYFQLWYKNKVFERSKTLDLFAATELPKTDVLLNKSLIENIILPDGRTGRMLTTQFIPQIDSDIREEFGVSIEEFSKKQQPIVLAYAVSNEGLNQILWFVDIIFIFSSLSAVFVVRLIVFKVVDRGLQPLDKLNKEIQDINLNSDTNAISTKNLPEELMPIANGINHFLNENKILYSREKRLTSDIAHELKTPITELINLSEVALKFPHEKEITDNFTKDVLDISERLKRIVSGILLLQKSSSPEDLSTYPVNIEALIYTIIKRENKYNRQVKVSSSTHVKTISTNEFAIETVFTNLISNALYYSPNETAIAINIYSNVNTEKVEITISNISSYEYSQHELDKLFEPLWQKDASRTSSERYGIGLAIVKSYCEKLEAEITVMVQAQNYICFKVTI